ncbi:hypothetical protein VMCG_06894 [Cytospora schulzeri]|uniref:Uncharacterized protein n=1 Tax=Cytospora schulzeri TaxID=448051 RepID=A0A423W1Y3_9PEZI|nr:hypothetical protein VMCG_06894 [Valsa malicola]
MTLPKEKQQYKHRPATVVYHQMTPKLMLAYRIFSPGLANQEGLDKLYSQMGRITNDVYVDHEVVVENGKKMRKGVGILEDIKRQMNVTEEQIKEAYNAYKAEIERMIEEDQAYLAAKTRGEVDDENNVKRGTKRKSSGGSPSEATSSHKSSSSSPASTKGVQRNSPSSPVATPSRQHRSSIDAGTDALAKLSNALRRVEAMHGTLDIIHDFYTTQMVPRHEITETFQSAFSYMTRMRAYVQEIYEIVEGHDGEEREGGEVDIWEDDRTAVTRLVPRLIPMADEIPLRVAAMEGLMEQVSAITDELAKSAVEPTRRRFRAKLAELVKQAHTPVPPPYCEKDGHSNSRRGEGTRDPNAKRRRRNMNHEKPHESGGDQGSSKAAKATEAITIDCD